jgi:hypothetical protein
LSTPKQLWGRVRAMEVTLAQSDTTHNRQYPPVHPV